jgi:hypothetical protein
MSAALDRAQPKRESHWVCEHHYRRLVAKFGDVEVITVPPMGWYCSIVDCVKPGPFKLVCMEWSDPELPIKEDV